MANLFSLKNKAEAQRVLCFGAPKAGKTRRVAELLDRGFKILFIDLEGGIDPLLACCSDEQLERVEYVRLRDTSEQPVAVAALIDMWVQRKGWICEKHCKWKCALCTKEADTFTQIDLNEMTAANRWVIVIDSGTQFATSALNSIMKGKKIDLTDTEDQTSFAVFRAQGRFIDNLFSNMQASPNHIYLTAHEIEVQLPDKSKKLVPSIGTRQVAAAVGKYFSHVIRMSKTAQGHKGQSLTTTPNAETGSRWGLDINMAGVTLADFFEMPANIAELTGQTKKAVAPTLGAKPTTATAKPAMSAAAAALARLNKAKE